MKLLFGNKIIFFNIKLQNFNLLELRNDTGALWENFCIVEKMKSNHYNRKFVNSYFWRTYDQKEIDYIEEASGQLHAFEFKFTKPAKSKLPRDFMDTYKESVFNIITRDNFFNFIK